MTFFKKLRKPVAVAVTFAMVMGMGLAVQAAEPTYLLDASGVPVAVQQGGDRITAAVDGSPTVVDGVTVTVADGASQPGLDWVITGGTLRTGGLGEDGTGWLDANGGNRQLSTSVELTGAITVELTGASMVADGAVITLSFGDQSVELTLPSGTAEMGTVSHTFEAGTGYVAITHWAWDGGDRPDIGRLALRSIAIWENYGTAAGEIVTPAATPVPTPAPEATPAPAAVTPAPVVPTVNVPPTNDNATVIFAVGATVLLAAAVAFIVYKKKAVQ